MMETRSLGGSLRVLLCALVVGAAAILGHATEATHATPAGQTQAAITKLLNDFLTYNTDGTQHDRFWADDLIYTSSAGLVKTKPEIMKGFAEPTKAKNAKKAAASTYSAEDVVVRVYGDAAALTFRLVATNPDGTRATFRNSGMFLQRGGKWQAVTWQATKEPTAAK